MGADGGTIPKRCELVKKKKKIEKIGRDVKNASKWRTCQLSQQKLKRPIIADRLGNMYNKEAVLEAILNKAMPPNAIHIKGKKDFVELRLTENKDFKDEDTKGGEAYDDVHQTPFLCPISSVPMNGVNNFCFNWICGCVISEKAKLELSKESNCLGCGATINPGDDVMLYPSEELLNKYKEEMVVRKKEKKKGREAAVGGESSSLLGSSKDKQKTNQGKTLKKEETGESLKRKAPPGKPPGNLQDDPTKTNAYKKLFTTCEEAKNKPQGHWVTYNPLFY